MYVAYLYIQWNSHIRFLEGGLDLKLLWEKSSMQEPQQWDYLLKFIETEQWMRENFNLENIIWGFHHTGNKQLIIYIS